jgi:site-specific recombinase XerD
MAEKFQTLLGTDTPEVTAINLLNNSLAPSTYANHDSALRRFFAFCAEENITPL